MSKAQKIIAVILVVEIITAFIAGGYSCDGGLEVYLLTGVFALMASVFTIIWSDGLAKQQKFRYILLSFLLVIAIWLAGFFLGGFKILCKLF